MMDLNDKQKTRIANFITDIAKISIGALAFGQFLSKEPFNWPVFVIGVIISTLFLVIALCLESTNKKEK